MTTTSVQPKLLLRNARVVLPDRLLKSAAVLIEAGRIASIVASEAARLSDDVSLDLDGLTVYPGFIDVHLHGAVGVDTMDASAAQLSQVSQFLVTQGVTGWLPTLVPATDESYAGAVKEVGRLIAGQQNATPQGGARVLGVHYEGPFVNNAQCGALHAEYFQSYSDAAQLNDLPVLTTTGATMMMTLAPEIGGGLDLVRDLSSKGWIVSLGHTRAEPEVLDRAHRAGAHHMTHFMNAMAPLHQRSPGPVAWEIWGETFAVSNGRTSNAAGSIAGSVITMLDAVRLMLSLGVSEVDAAVMASTNPARLLRLNNECGSIEEGKRADLVALDEHGNVRLTIVGGSVAFQASAM